MNTLKKGDTVKVEIESFGKLIDCGTYEVKEQGKKLGIDYNKNKSPYTCAGSEFVPFCCFASSVVFTEINTGEQFYYSNLYNKVISVNQN